MSTQPSSLPTLASQDLLPESKFTILVASDIHLGYAEKDVLRGDDTYTTFEEVLQIARAKDVDFVLLGGDLFHENKPSSKAMTRCVELLRKYCLGSKDIPINVVSDQEVNFNHSYFPVVNYEDENLKICLPVFSIHGNHDDPVGKEPLCSLDTLSAMGLVNFFGKYVNIEKIDVQPLLLEKEENKIALYGLGAVPEERLHRLFLQERVDFIPPEGNSERWFKIFVVHQNRVAHGTKYLPEKFLGNLPDLVVWGHEHESFTEMTFNEENQFYVYQPGSTVATSLCPGESAPKHVGLVHIYYDAENDTNSFLMEPIPLKTTRRLICEDINIDNLLSNRGDRDDDELNQVIFEFIADKIQDVINMAAVEHSGDPREPKEPLIRIRAEYSTDYHHLNPGLFGHRFIGKVANPKDLVMFKCKRNRSNSKDSESFDRGELDELMEFSVASRCNIDDVIYEYFANTDERNKLTLLSEKIMVEAIKEIVEKEQTTDRLAQAVDFFRIKIHDMVTNESAIYSENKEEIEKAIKDAKDKYMRDEARVLKELKHLFTQASQSNGDQDMTIDDNMSDDDFSTGPTVGKSPPTSSQVSTSRARGRGRGRGAGRGRGRNATQSTQGTLDSLISVKRR
ncbi:double-strand break repair protein MRE11 [Tetranychus urticae]|uniref:Double-strand break repair protein n=1 Tax=Tetranychus urticae TaxID=32264 RepID=T1KDA6_TETUR|nr:double-strand break repair protein MRE11 [Tetranychus urticae]